MEAITYAVADGPPDDWRDLKVFDLDTGHEVERVIEVDAASGWLVRFCVDCGGHLFVSPENPGEAARERIEGRFEIRRPE